MAFILSRIRHASSTPRIFWQSTSTHVALMSFSWTKRHRASIHAQMNFSSRFPAFAPNMRVNRPESMMTCL